MSSRPPRPPGAAWLTPYLTVRDAGASLAFYQRAFGFEPTETMPGPDGQIVHAGMRYQGETVLMMAPEGAWGGTTRTPVSSGVEGPIGLYLYCEDVDALFARAREAGAEVVSEPAAMFWGDRMCTLKDPDGHQWSFATNVADFDPAKVPGP